MKIFEKELCGARLVFYIRSEAHITQGNPEKSIPARPFALVIPGGGYHMNCEREAEPMALSFLNEGFNAAVLYYSVDTAVFPEALIQAASAVAYIRTHAEELNADPNRITLFGASAGGHLAASVGTFWNTPLLRELTNLPSEQMQPNSLVLAYPVITSGEKAHRNSFLYLLKDKADDPEMLELLSLEKHITPDFPPTFLWTTRTDTLVPVENSLMLAAAMQNAGVNYELHVYPTGEHGSALCTAETIMTGSVSEYSYMAEWIRNAFRFLNNL